MKGLRSTVPLLVALLLAGLAVLVWLPGPPVALPPRETAPPAPRTPTSREPGPLPASALSVMAPPPDWSTLNLWQGTVPAEIFRSQLDGVFTVSNASREWFRIGEGDVLIATGVDGEDFRLRFAPDERGVTPPRGWRAAAEFGPAPEGRPLEGLKVAIDPGHIGGRWARVEERWFQLGEGFPVAEGDMTLLVATILRPRLEALGADVSLVRSETEPVTEYRPEDLLEEFPGDTPEAPQKLAERLFYRTAEIRARADRVNGTIRPDLVLCLHFNAEPWGNPAKPTLVDKHHFHLILNGAYMDSELAFADQRYELTRRIVSRTHDEERKLAEAMADSFVRHTGLPPYIYETNSRRAVNVGGNPYVWARNLLANRLYHCPVVFLEPYVMNSVEDYARIQAGDYEGLREVRGKERPSIFREYADAVADGLARYYTASRRPTVVPAPGP